MKRPLLITTCVLLASSAIHFATADDSWVIDSQAEWQQSTSAQSNLEIKAGIVVPTQEKATLRSTLKTFEEKRSAKSIVFDQSTIWQNWEPVKNIGPSNLQDAPVALTLGPDNYWIFGRYGTGQRRRRGEKPQKRLPFTPKPAKLDGFDIPLQTTRFPNQFDAPGGLKPGKGGYHAWQIDFDSAPETYSMTFNLPLDELNQSVWILAQ